MAARWSKPCQRVLVSLRAYSAPVGPQLPRMFKPRIEGGLMRQRVVASICFEKTLQGKHGGGKETADAYIQYGLPLGQDPPNLVAAQLSYIRCMRSEPNKSSRTEEPSDQSKASNVNGAISSTLYITTLCLEGTVMKESVCIKLLHLLAKEKDMCFENSSSSDGFQWLSPFLQEILKKIMFIAFKKFEEDGSFFKFDPLEILILKDEGLVLEVGISKSQLVDGATKCDYEDPVLGPFAELLCSTLFTGGFTRTDGLFKEVCQLLHVSCQKDRCWKTLQDIYSRPLFWSVEEKYIAIICARTFLSNCKSTILHGLEGLIPARTFKFFTNDQFKTEFVKCDFYSMEFQVDMTVKSGPFKSVRTKLSPQPDWKLIFAKSFGPTYNFGSSKKRFSRVIISHFFDDNFTGYAVTLDKQSIKTAVIHLDCSYNLCISTYCTLEKLKQMAKLNNEDLDIKDILDIVYRISKW